MNTQETTEKRPKGRPKGTIKRRYRGVYLTDSEYLKVKKFINRIKEVE